MKRRNGALARILITALGLGLGMATVSPAQGRGGGPGGGGPGPGGGGPPGSMGGPQFPGGGVGPGGGPGMPGGPGLGGNLPQQPQQRGHAPDNRPGLQLGPPGRWWDDHSFAKSLKLRPDQQAHMDTIFEQNRATLVSSLDNVRQAEAKLDQLSRSSSPDEDVLFAQIQRVTQARAELEKAYTHMLLQLRKEMDPDQIKRLEKATQK